MTPLFAFKVRIRRKKIKRYQRKRVQIIKEEMLRGGTAREGKDAGK